MRRAAIATWTIAALLAIAALTFGLLLLMPAMSALSSAENRAREAAAGLARVEGTSVGEKFASDLRQFAAKRAEKAADIRGSRARLAGQRFDAPFREMSIGRGASRPTGDEFQRAYGFHGDQLKSLVREYVSHVGGPEVREIPLMTPPFSGGNPPDDAVIRLWQRFANIETKCLETAARFGAPPAAAMTIVIDPPPADDADSSYERLRIGLELLCPEGKTSAITHALLAAFDDHGAITRLAGLREAPVPEARLREKPATPVKQLTLSLAVGFPTPPEEGQAP